MTTPRAKHDALVRWLMTPDAYAHRPDRVEQIETHISHVFLAGPHVYKLKKPVKYDFLDFSTVEARELACREELRLNRRLAADAYIDVVPVTASADDRFTISGPGTPIDWLVYMRRLPIEMTLDALHRHGALTQQQIDRLAETLVSFYRSLTPLPLTPAEYRERCQAHVRGNLRELLAVKHHLPRGVIERIHGFQLQLLLLEPSLVENRVVQGRIVDGHGDLRPEHICLGEPVMIFDCLEFSRELRSLDVADELAFLHAECDFLGAEWVGPRLLNTYQDQTGDQPSAVLLDFYKSYRACVRAKVAALRADQIQGDEQQSLVAEATHRLAWADRYASPWLRPLVIVVGGLSGSGKTTLAAALADALAAEHLRTDLIRRELYGVQAEAAAIEGGIYTPQARGHVYDELFRQAAVLHADCINVVLDGTFSTVERVQQAKGIGANPRTIFVAIECVCPPAVAHLRIRERLAEGRDPSEARPEVYDVQRRGWQTWPHDPATMQVDTTRPVVEQVQAVIDRLKSRAQ